MTEASDGSKAAKRTQSAIRFPYYDLADAIEVARTLHQRGGDEASVDQLARYLEHKSVDSGSFRLRTAAAGMFGLIEADAGRVRLTPRAQAILSQQEEDSRQALVDAFLDVPLFERIYSQYQGRQLPPEEGLRSVMRNLGVVPNQIGRALSTLERSADTAGFFASGRGYLVAPAIRGRGGRPPATESAAAEPGDQSPMAVPPSRGVHPALMGLLQLLPPPGADWRRGKREWVAAFNSAIDAIYPENDGPREEDH